MSRARRRPEKESRGHLDAVHSAYGSFPRDDPWSTSLVVATILVVCRPGFLPEFWLPVLSVLFGYGAFLYMWVAEALLFRRYIEDHRKI